MNRLWPDAVFYHVYPLGALGAPERNDGSSEPVARLPRIAGWSTSIETLGADAVYLGPVFESETHGYDTIDHRRVDRRLGRNSDLKRLVEAFHEKGIAVVLDAVFNHVGRRHPVVEDVAAHGTASRYCRWIAGYDPAGSARGGLPFSYDGWKGHYDLVKLDTGNPEVREHLVDIALGWIAEFDIDGIRLDAADCLDIGFMRELGRRCRGEKKGFYLLGEAVHSGLYPELLKTADLDSVTNYEAWKGLWSSYNDRNYHEIAWTLNRQFGPGGMVEGAFPYSFADNHDVDRVASKIRARVGLYPLYALLFAMPGQPSIYYGSEYGMTGRKASDSDAPLRPIFDPEISSMQGDRDLAAAIARFSAARRKSEALRRGAYRAVGVKAEGLCFLRFTASDAVVVAVNGSASKAYFSGTEPMLSNRRLVDLLDSSYVLDLPSDGSFAVEVHPHWTRWLAVLA